MTKHALRKKIADTKLIMRKLSNSCPEQMTGEDWDRVPLPEQNYTVQFGKLLAYKEMMRNAE